MLWGLLIVLILFGGILKLGNFLNGVPKDKAIAVGYFTAVFYTFTFGFVLKEPLQNLLRPVKNQRLLFTAIGAVGSIMIETIIWWAQTTLKTTGAAISPNLFLDLFMTVPFYALLCYLLSKVVLKYRFSWAFIALAGGFYEVMADGIVGNLFQLNILGALISPILIPIFIVTYSPIILVPFLIISGLSNDKISPSRKDYLLFLKPTIAVLILPFSIGFGIILSHTIFK